MAKVYLKEELLGLLHRFERQYGRLPTLRDMRSEYNVFDEPITRLFGSWRGALCEYGWLKDSNTPCEPIVDFAVKAPKSPYTTTLVIPDAHVSPGQDLSRFSRVGQLIADRLPDRIISMGDFTTLESLSAWDLNKSGNMEGKRYDEDMTVGKEALSLMKAPMQKISGYNPNLVFIKGNHCNRLDRYLETKPELKGHMNLDKDLNLKGYGFTDIVEYRDYIEFDGVNFTHAPMNAANQPVSGKYAIHRAAEMAAKSTVFAHVHRKESVNYYRHGSDNIMQIQTAGAFFEHTEEYAFGGLNSYWRGLLLLTHWAPGRFDVEEISLERLNQMYGGGK